MKLKNTKNLNNISFKESLRSAVHNCTDSIAMLSHVNSRVEQNRRDNIAFTLDKQYHCLRKNIPYDSKNSQKE